MTDLVAAVTAQLPHPAASLDPECWPPSRRGHNFVPYLNLSISNVPNAHQQRKKLSPENVARWENFAMWRTSERQSNHRQACSGFRREKRRRRKVMVLPFAPFS